MSIAAVANSPVSCTVVKTIPARYEDETSAWKKDENSKHVTVRASISFPPDVYESLERIAKEKKVSLAWVVRDTTDKYIADKWPSFVKPGH